VNILQRCEEIRAELLLQLPSKFHSDLRAIQFEVSKTMTVCAGKAWPRKKLVRISGTIFRDSRNAHRSEAQLDDTIRHEVAHVIVGPGHGHDWVWQDCARACGARPEKCHNMAVTRRVIKRRQMAECERCNAVFPVTDRKARRIRSSFIGLLVHTACGGSVRARDMTDEERVAQIKRELQR